jgi:hypothetical protein
MNTHLVFGILSVWCVVGLTGAAGSCTSATKTTKTTKTVKVRKRPIKVVPKKACISGRVVDQDQKGLSGVFIRTKPSSSVQVTGEFGNFDICFARKLVDKLRGRAARVPLQKGKYVLTAKKVGMKSRPVRFQFDGNPLKLRDILMIPKPFKWPKVQKTRNNTDDTQRDNSTKGPTGS